MRTFSQICRYPLAKAIITSGSQVSGIHPKIITRRMVRNRKLRNTELDAIFKDRYLRAGLMNGASNPGNAVMAKKIAARNSRLPSNPALSAVG